MRSLIFKLSSLVYIGKRSQQGSYIHCMSGDITIIVYSPSNTFEHARSCSFEENVLLALMGKEAYTILAQLLKEYCAI